MSKNQYQYPGGGGHSGMPMQTVYPPAQSGYGTLYTSDGTPVDARSYLAAQDFADLPQYMNPTVNRFAAGHWVFGIFKCWRRAFWGTTIIVLGIVGGATIARGMFTGAVASAYGVRPVSFSEVDQGDWNQVGFALGSQVAWTGKAVAPAAGAQFASFVADDPFVAQQVSRQISSGGQDAIDAQFVNYVELSGGR